MKKSIGCGSIQPKSEVNPRVSPCNVIALSAVFNQCSQPHVTTASNLLSKGTDASCEDPRPFHFLAWPSELLRFCISSRHRQPLFVDMTPVIGRWRMAYRSDGPSATNRSIGPSPRPGLGFGWGSCKRDRWYGHRRASSMRGARGSGCVLLLPDACDPLPWRS